MIVLLSGCIILLLPALVNGYPFVYSDTGTYIRSAFSGYVPFDRPYWYGPFVYVTSFGGSSLWGTALVQTILCAVYIFRVTSLVDRSSNVWRTFLLICAGLVLFSSISWYTALLIPDIFTGIGALALFLLLQPDHPRSWRVFDVLVITAACWFHASNLPILTLSGAVAVLLHGRRGLVPRAAWYGVVLLCSWGGVMVANFCITGSLQVTRNSHVFIMGRMLDTGMLKAYLDEHCPTEDLGICAYREKLPEHSAQFLWNGDSPLALQGGWDATKEEYNAIISDSFSRLTYVLWHVRGSLRSTADQLLLWDICRDLRSTWYRAPSSPPRSMIEAHVPREVPQFLGSLQNGGRGELDMSWPDRAYRAGLALSLIMLLIGSREFRASAKLTAPQRFSLFALMITLVAAWVCASLSVVDARYLARNSWLIPLAAMLLITTMASTRWSVSARSGNDP